jgi:hypothetical protein
MLDKRGVTLSKEFVIVLLLVLLVAVVLLVYLFSPLSKGLMNSLSVLGGS